MIRGPRKDGFSVPYSRLRIEVFDIKDLILSEAMVVSDRSIAQGTTYILYMTFDRTSLAQAEPRAELTIIAKGDQSTIDVANNQGRQGSTGGFSLVVARGQRKRG